MWPCLGLGLALLVAGSHREPEEKKPVPLYTNEDLERVSPFRGETGVDSSPALPAPEAAAPSADEGRTRSEAYWHREADRLRDRLQKSRDRIEALRARVREREAQPSSRVRSRTGPGAEAQLEAWRRQLEAMEAAVREAEARFADRARRAGALPGWLR